MEKQLPPPEPHPDVSSHSDRALINVRNSDVDVRSDTNPEDQFMEGNPEGERNERVQDTNRDALAN